MNNAKPFFSIITCTKNSATTLPETIASVKAQTFQNFEHIFIDAQSTDKTLSLIRQYQKHTRYPVKIFSYPPKGISNAMNKGVNHSVGKYLFHLHSDDSFFGPSVLDKIHQFLLQHPHLDWIYGKINTINQDSHQSFGTFPNYSIFHLASPLILSFFNYIPHQSVFIKKKVFTHYGLFDENIKVAMDYDFWLRITNHTSWKFFNQIVSNYNISPASNSANPANAQKNIQEYDYIFKKNHHPLIYPIARIFNQFIESRNKIRQK